MHDDYLFGGELGKKPKATFIVLQIRPWLCKKKVKKSIAWNVGKFDSYFAALDTSHTCI